jgi:hypothetical protein
MFLQIGVGVVACALAFVISLLFGFDTDEMVTSCGVALAVTTWLARPGGLPKARICSNLAVLVIAIGLLMNFANQFPVCPIHVWRGLPCWVKQCPVTASPIKFLLVVQRFLTCPEWSRAFAVIGIGFVCGLTGVRAFATPLRHQSSRR